MATDYISQDVAVTIADYAADKHPYDKDTKKPETYSEYNRGWNDACDYIRDRLEREKPADVEPVVSCKGCEHAERYERTDGTAERTRWIPCSERLPHDVSRCLVCRYDYVTKTRFTDILWFESGIWWNGSHGGDYAVTHWKPLPELPEEVLP